MGILGRSILGRRPRLTRKQRAEKKHSAFLISALICGTIAVAIFFRENQSVEEFEHRQLAAGGGSSNDDGPTPSPTRNSPLCRHMYHETVSSVKLPIMYIGRDLGSAFFYTFMTLWIFIAIAIVCDEFFQPSLEEISEALGLSPDVAGATFLAAGSSAPELFTSTADTFGSSASVGLGTIIGSAMFNILIIVALSAAIAAKSGAALDIDWRCVTRDAAFYLGSIILLFLFMAVITPNWIEWWEGLIMTIAYGSYIAFMTKNEQFLNKMDEWAGTAQVAPRPGASGEEVAALEMAAKAIEGGEGGAPADEPQTDAETPPGGAESAGDDTEDKKDDNEEERGDWDRFALPESKITEAPHEWLYWVLAIPFIAAFTFTIPDCSYPWFQEKFGTKCKWISFGMSILWIGILCHYMVESSLLVACIANIDPIIIGLLVLSVGTSVPDAIGSMIAAREGEANMAIANAIGSNVFDVLLGLGLPWFIAGLTVKEDSHSRVCSDGILKWVIALVITVGIFYAILISNKWIMNAKLGYCLLALYGFFFLFVAVSPLIFGKDEC